MTHHSQDESVISRTINAHIAQVVVSYDVTGKARLYSGGVQDDERGRSQWDGDRIREIRDARRLTQEDLAKAAGVSKSEISRHERNAAKSNPTVAVLFKLAGALRVPVASLFEPVGAFIPRPEESGHDDRRPEGDSVLTSYLARLDEQTPAEDSVRGDILKAIAVLYRALKREDDSGTPAAQTSKTRQ